MRILAEGFLVCYHHMQSQPDQNQWNNAAAYYGYPQGYDSYGYVSAPQDPNMYYGGYPGYGGYGMPQQAQMPVQQQVCHRIIISFSQ